MAEPKPFHSVAIPYLQLLRIPGAFTVISNILAAHVLVTLGNPLWEAILFLCLASLCLYHGGMVLNDCFDFAEDARERPMRPLPSGQISRNRAWLLGYLLLTLGLVLAAQVGSHSFFIACGLIIAIISYDRGLKKTPIGAIVMASCRYLNWLLGMSTIPLTFDHFLIALPVFFYVFALTQLSKEETRAEYKGSLIICALSVVLAAIALVMLVETNILSNRWSIVFTLVGLSLLLYHFWRIYRDFEPQDIQRTVTALILGIIPLDALLVMAGGYGWASIGILALLVPGRLLAHRIYVT